MIRAVADTHAVLWYLYNDSRLSVTAGAMMDTTIKAGDEIAISSVSLVEIAYLVEKSRVPLDAFDRVIAELNTPGSNLQEVNLDQHIADSLRQVVRAQVPEMGDRIIAATALLLGVPVISRDSKITASSIATIW
ncbi:MAG TPA: type II toxin-antitoxin system VapC family toxin [Blastocatellia bacterium]|nr:type II toxin-antitoxin system VapC family toxin [Blastocatellia bacterium]HMX28913.1 type II toxin-antitoxin system VapC family toxin [Blastocatellia bacterium]HMY70852.1 type II toxin-antitoxin system VapC family toxin [Blastocatellia bacterium]HMZ17439.1 type II toxin-antitoxin system VapC family toxin [Blastocatellia bacterium]HNG28777.1 type II toxin-antitoxin system VapC family toxin [Blastocatellia bacterium]